MKNLILICLTTFSFLAVKAQESLQGVIQNDFEYIKSDPETNFLREQWHLFEPNEKPLDTCWQSGVIDLVFLVDATSSMQGQMDFLKLEIHQTLEHIQKIKNIQFRTAGVLYRDIQEEYEVRSSPFSYDLAKTNQFFIEQSAAGGGDYPEFLDKGLNTAAALNWELESDQKFLFVFCDAPAHDTDTSKKLFGKASRLLIQKGVQIIPVLGNEMNQTGASLMSILAMDSDGIVIRIKAESKWSDQQSLINIFEDFLQQQTSLEKCATPSPLAEAKMHISPNPAYEQAVLHTSAFVDKVNIYTTNGKLIFEEKALNPGEMMIDVGNWIPGMYFVHFVQEEEKVIRKLIIGK